MYKYLIQAYNETDYGPANEIRIRVMAPNETAAVERAKQIAVRASYAILEIEDIRDAELKKAELGTIPPKTIEAPGQQQPRRRFPFNKG